MTLLKNFPQILRLAGRSASFWLALAITASILLAGVELIIAAVLQLFLKSLDILAVDVSIFPALEAIEPSPATIAMILIGVAVFRALVQLLVFFGSYRAMLTITARLRMLMVYSVLRRKKQEVVAAARLHFLVSEIFNKTGAYLFATSQLVALGVQALVIGVILFSVAWREALVACVGLGLISALLAVLHRRSSKSAVALPQNEAAFARHTEKVVRNFFLIKTLRTQGLEYRRFIELVDRFYKTYFRTYMLVSTSNVAPALLGIPLLMLIVYFSQVYFATPGMILLSFLYLFMRFMQNLASGNSFMATVSQYSPQFHQAIEYFNSFSPEERNQAIVAPQQLARLAAGPLPDLEAGRSAEYNGPPPRISVRDVSFAYPGSEPVIDRLSIDVPSGAQFGVVGPSGGGKSTLLALLLGILRPSNGSVLINGAEVGEFFAGNLLRIGYVGAEPFLLPGTIRDTLLYGVIADKSDAEIWAVLDKAKIADRIRQLPMQLNAPINDDGSGFSAGEKQRLSLARALMNNPSLLILDEVTANVDPHTEAGLAEALRDLKGQCTTVIVSHRPPILKYADQILELRKS